MIEPGLEFIRSKATEISPTQDQNLLNSLLRYYRALLKDFDDPNYYNSIADIKIRF